MISNHNWARVQRPRALAVASLLLTLGSATHAAAQMMPAPTLSHAGAAVGDSVTVSMRAGGVPPDRSMSMGFGGLAGSYELVGRAQADSTGAFSITVAIPTWAEPNRIYYFFLNLGGANRLFSDPFIVTGPAGALQISGFVTELAPGCMVIAGFDETRYTLLGVTTIHKVDDRVTVDGSLAQAAEVPPAGAPCGGRPSIPLRVRAVRGD
jgi:hypothetical protein